MLRRSIDLNLTHNLRLTVLRSDRPIFLSVPKAVAEAELAVEAASGDEVADRPSPYHSFSV